MAKQVIESNVMEYSGIKSITGFTCIVPKESGSLYFNKEFRYSSDKILWSDYKQLTNKNLSTVQIYDGKIYIQYKFTQVGNGDISVENISLDVDYLDENTSVIPDCYWNMSKTQSPNIVFTQNNGNLFNPYAMSSSLSMYYQLSTLVSNMFGLCCLYFKTEPNARSRDVVLKEYSIEKVIDKQNIKVLVPDNQLPTREIQFNTLMIDYPVQFEVHIVKAEFQKIFGSGSHPDPHDYLYFSQYLNKMYMVDSVSDPDDFGYTASYWRVSLVPYQEMKSVQFGDDNLLTDTEDLIFSAEKKFEEEIEEEFADVAKENQLSDIGDLYEGQDKERRVLHEKVRIVDEVIYNDWTAISKQYYNLSYVDKGTVAVEYKHKGLTSSDERMFTFAFRPSNMKNVSDNIMVNSVIDNNGKVRLKMKGWDKLLVKGNMVKVSRIAGLNGWYRISGVVKTSLFVDLDVDYNSNMRVMSCAKIVCYETNTCIYFNDGFEILQMPDKMVVRINGVNYDYIFDGFSSFETKWYFCVLGMNKGMSNMWLYEVSGSGTQNNVHSEIKLIGTSANEFPVFEMAGYCGMMGGNIHITNFRLWDKLCEEELHKLILSQNIVDDTHNTIIVDNAKNELLVNYKWS